MPAGVLPRKPKAKGEVYWGLPLAGSFDHLELRWYGCQTLLPDSQHKDGPGYRWHGPEPTEPPAEVSIGHVLAAFFAVATPKRKEQPDVAQVTERRNGTAGDREVDEVKSRLDMVTYAARHWNSEAVTEGDEVRILGHGGLLIKPKTGEWYCFGDEIGGDAIDLVGYSLHGANWDRNDGRMFYGALAHAAGFAGVTLEERRNGHDQGDEIPEPPPSPPPIENERGEAGDDGIPWIYAGRPDVRALTADAWAAVIQANQRQPQFFRRGIPVRLERGDRGEPIVRELDESRARHELRRVAHWFKQSTNELTGQITRRIVDVPAAVASDFLATPNPPLPVLERIVTVPVFAADGTLHDTPGYSSATRCYYEPARGLVVPEVAEVPSQDDIARAKALLLDDLLGDFAFVGDSDRAHAVALALLPFVRDLIEGPTPNHMVTAPTPGSGKGLLAEVALGIADAVPRMIAEARDDDEWRKRITAALMDGHGAIVLDNVRNTLDSGALAMALTVRFWTDRILGRSETITLPVRCTWVTTANNPTTSTEIARRSIRIRLDPQIDQPWLREGFKYEDLRAWARDNRAALIWATLTLIRAWLATGRPRFQGRRLGSYESWSEVLGGILQTVGIPGFLGNLLDFYHEADQEGDKWRQLVTLWWEKHGNEPVTSGEPPLALSVDGFDFGDGSPRSMKIRFGLELTRQRDRVIGEYCITDAGTKQRAALWRLASVAPKVNVVNVGECSDPHQERG